MFVLNKIETMVYFDADFRQFFKDLSKNNNKEWFHANKKRYDSSVKAPFYYFIDELINKMQVTNPDIRVTSKDCVLRINRDIRFSKDKTPYNLYYTALVSSVGKKDKSVPGLYLRFSPESLAIMSGCYMLDKLQLERLRNAIADDIPKFRQLIEEKKFKNSFGEIRGEKMKRIPKELRDAVVVEPLIANKQFYYVAERESALLESPDLMNEMLTYWEIMQPLNNFLLKNTH